jgi:hypothetical protein
VGLTVGLVVGDAVGEMVGESVGDDVGATVQPVQVNMQCSRNWAYGEAESTSHHPM